MARSNVEVIETWFLDMWNNDKPELMPELYAEDGVAHGLGERDATVTGPKDYLPFYQLFRTAFPDIHFTILDHVVDGHKIATRWRATATHAGDFLGNPATGKPVELSGLVIAYIRDGKIGDCWNTWDSKGLLEQLDIDTRSKLIDRTEAATS